MPCPYCKDNNFSSSYLPSTLFNNKQFDYVQCSACGVVYIDPFPSADDYVKMYPPEYQSGVDRTIHPNPYKKLSGLRFSYGVQFDLLKKYSRTTAPLMMDYGCGNANFLLNARHHGFRCDGAEFNQQHVDILKKEIPGSNFYTIDEFIANPSLQYDVIRLSNVLEHLDYPMEVFQKLVSKLTTDGILLVEGPIEMNFNIAQLSRKKYFMYKNKKTGKYIASHTPTHITFTNSKNQLQFFQNLPLTTLRFIVAEAAWPYPFSISETKGIGGKLKAMIAKLSMLISSMVAKWGNTFIYVGRKK